MVPRETGNNAYAKFGGQTKTIMVFSTLVNICPIILISMKCPLNHLPKFNSSRCYRCYVSELINTHNLLEKN